MRIQNLVYLLENFVDVDFVGLDCLALSALASFRLLSHLLGCRDLLS